MEWEGEENVFALFEEMGELMMHNCTVSRTNEELDATIAKLREIRERYSRIGLDDTSRFVNNAFWFAYRLGPMIELALVIAAGARWREESRGAHYKPETPEPDDANWLFHTLAEYSPEGPKLSKIPVDLRHWDPVGRDYVHQAHVVPEPKQVPDNIVLPL